MKLINILKEASIKNPKSVKIGDIATNKHGKNGKIIAIGTIGNDWKDMKKFASNSDIPALIKSTPSGAKGYLDNLTIIAVKYNNGRTEVWTYDSDNAYVPILKEAFAANSKLSNALNYLKKNAEILYDDNQEIIDAIAAVKSSGLTSRDIFSFASLFPRDTFKVDDIRSGKLEAQVDRVYFDGSDMLNKAKALKAFLLAFDNHYHGDKNWYKGY